MNQSRAENVIVVHWHDLGRYLAVYGHEDVASPRLDQLAAEGILFTRAHATAPLCSPSRGSLFTGRYPHSNGLVGLAHHGFEYREGTRTLPDYLSEVGYRTALFGMQHETSFPSRLGYDEFDVSNSYCDNVVEKAQRWLTESVSADDNTPFLLNLGFFETHRPYPGDLYVPADPARVVTPDYLPDTDEVRSDLAAFYGAIAKADKAVGEVLDTLADCGLDTITWVIFTTDHGPALPRAKSTLYDAGTGIALIVRPPRQRAVPPQRYDELFSGVDLLPTLLDLLGLDQPAAIEGLSHANAIVGADPHDVPVRSRVFSEKTYHDSFDPIRAVRTKEHSYIENYARRPLLDMPMDIEESPAGRAVAASVRSPRPERELYDLVADPTERHNLLQGEVDAKAMAIADDMSMQLHEWRERTGDVIPSEYVGTRIATRYTEKYLELLRRKRTLRSVLSDESDVQQDSTGTQ